MARIEADSLLRFFKQETPSGVIDGVNDVFTLSQIPLEDDAVEVYLNGLKQIPVVDYTISGATITFVIAPALAQTIDCFYIQKRGE
jgi:hypothetical protein